MPSVNPFGGLQSKPGGGFAGWTATGLASSRWRSGLSCIKSGLSCIKTGVRIGVHDELAIGMDRHIAQTITVDGNGAMKTPFEAVDLAAKVAARRALCAVEQPRTLRAVEIQWRQLLEDVYPGTMVLPWSTADYGLIGLMVTRVPVADVLKLLDFGIRHWKYLRATRGMEWLPPIPTLRSFHAIRDRIAAEFSVQRRKQKSTPVVIEEKPAPTTEEVRASVSAIPNRGLREVLERMLEKRNGETAA